MSEPVLRVEGLAKSFGALTATDDVTLDLRAGEIHALIGPNGAGKSTLIGQIAGGIAPDRGRILLAGEDIARLSVAARARRGLGRTFQVSSLGMELSARRNAMIAAQAVEGSSFRFRRAVRRDRALREAAGRALARAGLPEGRADVPAEELSHGERRQVELACALALKPRALLLDEPTAGLGAEETEALAGLLDALRREVPILLVEHDMDTVFRLADRISVLVRGRVIAAGTGAEIRANRDVRDAYLGESAQCWR